MNRYLTISGLVFGVIAIAHVVRVALGWPVTVGTYAVPTWASAIAFVVCGWMAGWAVRLSRQPNSR